MSPRRPKTAIEWLALPGVVGAAPEHEETIFVEDRSVFLAEAARRGLELESLRVVETGRFIAAGNPRSVPYSEARNWYDDQWHPDGLFSGARLTGGIKISTMKESHQRHVFHGEATLGFIAEVVNAQGASLTPRRAVAVSTLHPFFIGTQNAVVDTEIGHPFLGSWSACCHCGVNGAFGKYKSGYLGNDANGFVDAALFELNPGTRWFAEVDELGVITGVEAPVVSTAVQKRGGGTGLTAGEIAQIGVVVQDNAGRQMNDMFLVRPTATNLTVGGKGDSGAAIVNPSNGRIIGILVGISVAAPGATTAAGWGVAYPVQRLLARLTEPLKLNMASAPDVEQLTGASTQSAIANERVRAERASALIRSSPGALAAYEMWRRHGPEILALVRTHKRMAACWRRYRGPALLQSLFDALDDPQQTFDYDPLAIAGLSEGLSKYGSPELRDGVARMRKTVPNAATKTLPELFAALGAQPIEARE